MTSQSLRIYIYKITFEEVPYYYYGVHKEKKFDDYYMGSSVTHKWMWNFYTPKKQILEIFDYSDEGWIEAQEVETRLIRPFYNTDKWCLNEHCGGLISLEVRRKNGKKVAEKNKQNNLGIFGLTPDEIIHNASEGGKIGGKVNAKNKTGVCGRSKEKMTEDGKKGGSVGGKINGRLCFELKKGFFALSKEERKKASSKGGKQSAKMQKELGIGMFALSPEQLSEKNRKSALQRWQCCETGYISSASGISQYQKARGIDTSKTNRRRIS
jgi:hypothetical protein